MKSIEKKPVFIQRTHHFNDMRFIFKICQYLLYFCFIIISIISIAAMVCCSCSIKLLSSLRLQTKKEKGKENLRSKNQHETLKTKISMDS